MTSDEHARRTHRLKVATLWILMAAALVGTAVQLWWWYTGHLDPFEIFWPPLAVLGLATLLEMRWGLMLEGDENAA